jgi:hypothetical protein
MPSTPGKFSLLAIAVDRCLLLLIARPPTDSGKDILAHYRSSSVPFDLLSMCCNVGIADDATAPHAGYITKGDANQLCDQEAGISPSVRMDKGTAHVHLPFGWVRLLFGVAAPVV